MGYKGRVFIRQREWRCGDWIDVDIYPVFQPPGRRRAKCKPTSETQKLLNRRDRERRVTRILRENFSERDYVLTLTYRKTPESIPAAKTACRNFLRRLKRRYSLAGIELKYLYTTEVGKTTGRVHHHLVISGGVDRDEIEAIWGEGFANTKRLQIEDDGLQALASYITKTEESFRRYTPSRNLVIPQPVVRDGLNSISVVETLADAIGNGTVDATLEAMYPGYTCRSAACTINTRNRGLYIRLVMQKTSTKAKSDARRRGRINC